MRIPVMFRVSKLTGEVMAIFTDIKSPFSHMCPADASRVRVKYPDGLLADRCRRWIINNTTLAAAAEYKTILAQLREEYEDFEHTLYVANRFSFRMTANRRRKTKPHRVVTYQDVLAITECVADLKQIRTTLRRHGVIQASQAVQRALMSVIGAERYAEARYLKEHPTEVLEVQRIGPLLEDPHPFRPFKEHPLVP